MSLSAGERLGPYEILNRIGAGGMGEVYRARDTRLERTIAIKVSSAEFSERFEREARAVAALNHPYVCQLYDVGPNYLVMEYISGKPLKGPLPLEQTLKYAAQICDALDAAHRHGITHRDLKPANILLTNSGVKLLDFGLAKIAPAVTAVEATMTMALTGKGEILGTLHYMSPEQLQGEEADARSDIFSLGLVIYEILTGSRAFDGASPASVIAAILEREAPSIAGIAPPALDRLLRRCLEKNPDDRWQTARDLKAELEWIASGGALAAPHAIRRRAFFPWIAGAAAGAAAGAGIAAWAWRGGGKSIPLRPIRFRLAPPEGTVLQRMVTRQSVALSPMGGSVAMIASDERGSRVWVQRFDSLVARPLAGTEGASVVFWSPDSQFIGFWANGRLKRIPAEGGAAFTLCDLPDIWSATWSRDGAVVAGGGHEQFVVSVKSGEVKPVILGLWPQFLPDSKRVLHIRQHSKAGGVRACATELSSGRATELIPTDTKVVFAPDRMGSTQGYLLFVRGAVLQALRFDAERLQVTGDPVPVAQDVPFFSGSSWSEFDASADGVLIHSVGSQKEQLKWFDRRGRELSSVGDRREYLQGLRISPDGKKVAAAIADPSVGGSDIWLYDLQHATAERVTFDPGVEQYPVWAPDGAHIAFGSSKNGPGTLMVKALGDRGDGEAFPDPGFKTPRDWSSDGRWIFYTTMPSGGNGEIRLASVASRKLMPLLKTAFDCTFPALSPNRDYLAFSANDSGRYEIYGQRFEDGDEPKLTGERRRISRDGGNVPRWRRDGKELFFLSPDRQIVAVDVTGSGGEFGSPIALFRMPTSFGLLATAQEVYDVSADGQDFILRTGETASPSLQVVVNWTDGLKNHLGDTSGVGQAG